MPGKIGDDETPADVPWISTGAGPAISVAASQNHSCAMFEGGGVKCWGFGQLLGYGMVSPNLGDDEVPADYGFVDFGI